MGGNGGFSDWSRKCLGENGEDHGGGGDLGSQRNVDTNPLFCALPIESESFDSLDGLH